MFSYPFYNDGETTCATEKHRTITCIDNLDRIHSLIHCSAAKQSLEVRFLAV